MRGLLAKLLASLLLLVVAQQATACANDKEANTSERKFRSLYNKDAPEEENEPEYSPDENRTKSLAFLGMGVVLLAGAGLSVARYRAADRDA